MYRNAIDEERQRAHDETISDERYWRTVVHEAAHCVIAERLQPGAALGMEVQRGQAGAWNGSATLDAPLGSRESALAESLAFARRHLRQHDLPGADWRPEGATAADESEPAGLGPGPVDALTPDPTSG